MEAVFSILGADLYLQPLCWRSTGTLHYQPLQDLSNLYHCQTVLGIVLSGLSGHKLTAILRKIRVVLAGLSTLFIFRQKARGVS